MPPRSRRRDTFDDRGDGLALAADGEPLRDAVDDERGNGLVAGERADGVDGPRDIRLLDQCGGHGSRSWVAALTVG